MSVLHQQDLMDSMMNARDGTTSQAVEDVHRLLNCLPNRVAIVDEKIFAATAEPVPTPQEHGADQTDHEAHWTSRTQDCCDLHVGPV